MMENEILNQIPLSEWCKINDITLNTGQSLRRRSKLNAVKKGRDWFVNKDQPYPEDRRFKTDWHHAFDLLRDRLVKDELTCGQNTPDNLTQLTDSQILCIGKIADSCIEDATNNN